MQVLDYVIMKRKFEHELLIESIVPLAFGIVQMKAT